MSKPRVRVKASSRPSSASFAGARAAHAAADVGMQATAGWLPPLLSADSEWLHERDLSVARIRDMVRNEGWVQAGVDRTIDMAVGATFRLNAKPNARALGINQEQAEELALNIESEFALYCNDPTFRCDVERTLPFAGNVGLLARECVSVGDGVGIIRWRDLPGWDYRTAFQVLDADRLSNPNGQPNNAIFRNGIERNRDGAPIAYHFRRGHPGEAFLGGEPWAWDRVPRFDQIGTWERPKVLHLFEKRRAGQSRGVSKLVAALVNMRLLSRFAKSEVSAAAINGSIIGAIYTQMGAEFAAEAVGNDSSRTDWQAFNADRGDFYSDRRVLSDARFLTLYPSDRLDLNTTPRQTSGFPQFQTAFLQAFAAALGISYEQLSMDWSKTNYSSARAALNEVWRSIQRMRSQIVWMVAQPFYTAWLEEAIDIGRIVLPAAAPDFYDAPAAYLQAEWTGPGRGYVDPVKEAQAAALRIQARISTLERECAEQGLDYQLVLAQLAREASDFERYGLQPPMSGTIAGYPSDDPAEQPKPASN